MKLLAYKYDGRKDVIKKMLGNSTQLDYNYVKDSDLLSPTISISVSDDINFTFFDYNYVVLNYTSSNKDFGSRKRCYFINPERVTNVAKGLWHVGLTFDDLTTYQDEILSSTANISRSSSSYNLYLNDDFYNAFAYPRIGCKEFPYGFSDDYTYLLNVCNTLGSGETVAKEVDINGTCL